MANNEFTIPIPARLKNVAKGGHVAGAKDIIDDALGKEQSVINQDRIDDIANIKGGSTKSISDLSEDIANEAERASGVEAGLRESIDELGQIGLNPENAISTDGDDFDGDTTAKRSKIPTIGAIIDGNPGVYDVSKRNPTGGPNGDGTFTLEYILENADTLISTSRRHGGMEICFVQSYDNKYVQYRYMGTSVTGSPNPFLDTTNWQGVDEELVENSKNSITSGAVKTLELQVNGNLSKFTEIVAIDGQFSGGTNYAKYFIKKGCAFKITNKSTSSNTIVVITTTTKGGWDAGQGRVDTIGNIAVGTSISFTASGDANYFGIYSSNNSDVVIESVITTNDILQKNSYENVRKAIKYLKICTSQKVKNDLYIRLIGGTNKYLYIYNSDNTEYALFFNQNADNYVSFPTADGYGYIHALIDWTEISDQIIDTTQNIVLSPNVFCINESKQEITNKRLFSSVGVGETILSRIGLDKFISFFNNIRITGINSNFLFGIAALKRPASNENGVITIKNLSTNFVYTYAFSEDNPIISFEYYGGRFDFWVNWNVFTEGEIWNADAYRVTSVIDSSCYDSEELSPCWKEKGIIRKEIYSIAKDTSYTGYASYENGYYNTSVTTARRSDFVKIKPSHRYMVSCGGFIAFYSEKMENALTDPHTLFISGLNSGNNGLDYEFTTPNNAQYLIYSVLNEEYRPFAQLYDIEIDSVDSLNIVHSKPFDGRKVVCFGDSILGLKRGGWTNILQDMLGGIFYNIGFPGCRMELISESEDETLGTNPFSMCGIVDAIVANDWTSQDASPLLTGDTGIYSAKSLQLLKQLVTNGFGFIDTILIAYGTNEYGYPQENPNDQYDKMTYGGATRYCVEKFARNYPGVNIILLTPVYRYAWGSGTTDDDSDTHVNPVYGGTLLDNIETLKDVAHEYKLTCIDMYYNMGINKINRDNYYYDGTHLNYNGLLRYAQLLRKSIL